MLADLLAEADQSTDVLAVLLLTAEHGAQIIAAQQTPSVTSAVLTYLQVVKQMPEDESVEGVGQAILTLDY